MYPLSNIRKCDSVIIVLRCDNPMRSSIGKPLDQPTTAKSLHAGERLNNPPQRVINTNLYKELVTQRELKAFQARL